MSISLATKGIIFFTATPKNIPVSVCEPDVSSHEYGTKYMGGKELKPKIKTKRIVRYEKKYLE